MNRRATKKGRAASSLLIPSNASLIINPRRDKSPKKSPHKTAKNAKSKSCGGVLALRKKKNSSSSSISDQESQPASSAFEEQNFTRTEEAIESALRSRPKRKRSRKTKELLTNDNVWHSDALYDVQQNEAGLPKIDMQTTGEPSKDQELSNQNNSFNEKPNQPILDCDLNLIDCTTDGDTKYNRSTNLRNKPLIRELNTYAESLFKLSRATKLTGTINKGRRNVERQQEKTLRNITVRRKYPQPGIKSSNESIKIDEKKAICSPASVIKKPVLRKKMPDFSAIHQQNFGKMESIVDHLERKARRAIVLKTSTVKKAKPGMKKGSSDKKSIVEHLGRKTHRPLELTPSTNIKVRQDVNKESTSKKVCKSASFTVRQQANSKYESPASTKGTQLKCVRKLDTKFDKIQSNKNVKILPKTDTTFDKIESNKKVTQENVKILPKAETKFHKIQSNKAAEENVNILPKSRAKFDQIKANKTAIQENVNILPKAEVSKTKVEELNDRILEKRVLYKGKIEVDIGTRQKKNMEILRGVRSNRRFELQMKYRNSRD